MKRIIFYIFILFSLYNSLFALTFEWSSEKAFNFLPEEKLMTIRYPIVLSKNRIIEPGFLEYPDKKDNAALYWILKADSDNSLKIIKKININEQTNSSKNELKKLYTKVKKYEMHTAYRGEAVPDSNTFFESVFSWFSTNKNALYRFGTLDDKNEIIWSKYQNYSLNTEGEIYNGDFTITENGYIFGVISVLTDFKTESYSCYYNFGKIQKNKVDWKYDSFSKNLMWAKHEISACSLKNSYMLLCSDPASVQQKYSICRITESGSLIIGKVNTFNDFISTYEPTYISDLDLVVFPGKYKKDDKWVQATAVYKIDYEDKMLKDVTIQDLPESSISETPVLDYLPEVKKLMITKYHNNDVIYYAFADIKNNKAAEN